MINLNATMLAQILTFILVVIAPLIFAYKKKPFKRKLLWTFLFLFFPIITPLIYLYIQSKASDETSPL